jgi:hypothetical protein
MRLADFCSSLQSFCTWLNHHASMRQLPPVEAIDSSLGDGVVLLNVVEIITGKSVRKFSRNPKAFSQKYAGCACLSCPVSSPACSVVPSKLLSGIHLCYRVDNIVVLLQFMERELGLRIAGYNPRAICEGNFKQLGGLIFLLMQKEKALKEQEDAVARSSRFVPASPSPPVPLVPPPSAAATDNSSGSLSSSNSSNPSLSSSGTSPRADSPGPIVVAPPEPEPVPLELLLPPVLHTQVFLAPPPDPVLEEIITLLNLTFRFEYTQYQVLPPDVPAPAESLPVIALQTSNSRAVALDLSSSQAVAAAASAGEKQRSLPPARSEAPPLSADDAVSSSAIAAKLLPTPYDLCSSCRRAPFASATFSSRRRSPW